jgi:phosphoglycolate phosphatase
MQRFRKRSFVQPSGPARAMIEEALRRAGTDENIDKMLAEFLVHYKANIAVESRRFPGAVA